MEFLYCVVAAAAVLVISGLMEANARSRAERDEEHARWARGVRESIEQAARWKAEHGFVD